MLVVLVNFVNNVLSQRWLRNSLSRLSAAPVSVCAVARFMLRDVIYVVKV
jgi:hypothetical protein